MHNHSPIAEAIGKLKAFTIETPSWAYGDSGTRFKVFHQRGAARNLREKLADAAEVHRLTGVTPSVAVHVLWDFADTTPEEAASLAESLGLRLGSINPTLFEREAYKFGSLANPNAAVRKKALDHIMQCIDIMRRVHSNLLSLWLADGTNYPGQDNLAERKHRVTENLQAVHDALDDGMTMLIEYKFFEPAFYATDIADWGMAAMFCGHCGPRAKVLVDLGHHAPGANIEQIVALLIDEGLLGGFHFNSKKYGDDDLTTGSLNPYELFLIFNELVAAGGGAGAYRTAYMIDQSHNTKPKIAAMIQSVMNIQETCAKALLVDRKALATAQAACDVIGAERIMKSAFNTDVTAMLAAMREELGRPPDPLAAYRQGEYQDQIEKDRG